MIYTYKELLAHLGSAYQIAKEIKKGTICKLFDGIYSNSENYSPIEYIAKKFPNSVFTFTSSLFFYGLIDNLPDKYCLACKKNSTRIRDKNVHQFFVDNLFEGVNLLEYNGVELKVYCLEKSLICLIKNRNKIDRSLYHFAIRSFRLIENRIDKIKLAKFLCKEKCNKSITRIIYDEVF
ncbi:MAG: hypothetical protein WC366_00595 [Bacilli bacterium]|jgi:hypothetical protein